MAVRTQGYLPHPVTTLLRWEGVAMFAAGVFSYASLGGSWWHFAVLLMVPDISMLAVLAAGQRVGTKVYNAFHSLLGPAALAGLGWLAGVPQLGALAAIWLAHIGMDRALGQGLKFPGHFLRTHLGPVGRGGPRRRRSTARRSRPQVGDERVEIEFEDFVPGR